MSGRKKKRGKKRQAQQAHAAQATEAQREASEPSESATEAQSEASEPQSEEAEAQSEPQSEEAEAQSDRGEPQSEPSESATEAQCEPSESATEAQCEEAEAQSEPQSEEAKAQSEPSENDEARDDNAQEQLPGSDETRDVTEREREHLKGLIEALVFATDKPIRVVDLARITDAPNKLVRALLGEITEEYRPRGIQLGEVSGGYLFRTNPRYGSYVRELTQQKPVKLTRAQIETLAILAYRQPITRPEIDEIRGVDSGPVLKMLLERELIKILGKKDEPGRPLLYGTTPAFLAFFGLKSLKELPNLRQFTELTDESHAIMEKELGESWRGPEAREEVLIDERIDGDEAAAAADATATGDDHAESVDFAQLLGEHDAPESAATEEINDDSEAHESDTPNEESEAHATLESDALNDDSEAHESDTPNGESEAHESDAPNGESEAHATLESDALNDDSEAHESDTLNGDFA